jgi:hypothetical protein
MKIFLLAALSLVGFFCGVPISYAKDKSFKKVFPINDTTYGEYIDPLELLSLANDNRYNLQPGKDLLAGSEVAVSAMAVYQNNVFTGVGIGPFFPTYGGGCYESECEKAQYQRCFNQIYTIRVSQGSIRLSRDQMGVELNRDELKEFTNTFNNMCVKYHVYSECRDTTFKAFYETFLQSPRPPGEVREVSLAKYSKIFEDTCIKK